MGNIHSIEAFGDGCGLFTARHTSQEATEVGRSDSRPRDSKTPTSSAARSALPHTAPDARQPIRSDSAGSSAHGLSPRFRSTSVRVHNAPNDARRIPATRRRSRWWQCRVPAPPPTPPSRWRSGRPPTHRPMALCTQRGMRRHRRSSRVGSRCRASARRTRDAARPPRMRVRPRAHMRVCAGSSSSLPLLPSLPHLLPPPILPPPPSPPPSIPPPPRLLRMLVAREAQRRWRHDRRRPPLRQCSGRPPNPPMQIGPGARALPNSIVRFAQVVPRVGDNQRQGVPVL